MESEDLFLDYYEVCVIYLDDYTFGVVHRLPWDHGTPIESGDPVQVPDSRVESQEDGAPPAQRTAVVLGVGLTHDEAVERGTQYYRRVSKWDGDEEASQIHLDHQDTSDSSDSSDSDSGSSTSFGSEGDRILEREREKLKKKQEK